VSDAWLNIVAFVLRHWRGVAIALVIIVVWALYSRFWPKGK
jgi:hypothetical protein